MPLKSAFTPNVPRSSHEDARSLEALCYRWLAAWKNPDSSTIEEGEFVLCYFCRAHRIEKPLGVFLAPGLNEPSWLSAFFRRVVLHEPVQEI